MKVSKGQSQPEIVAAAFLILYMALGSPFLYQVLIVTQLSVGSHESQTQELMHQLLLLCRSECNDTPMFQPVLLPRGSFLLFLFLL